MKLRNIVKKIIRLFPSKSAKPTIDIIIGFSGIVEAEIQSPSNQTVLSIANKNDIDIPHYCGGYSRCGTCVIKVLSNPDNLSVANGNEIMVLGIDKFEKGHRLACQAHVHGNVQVYIPDWF